MAYDYREAVKADVEVWLDENSDYIKEKVDVNNREKLEEFLHDTMWIADRVTGNASGSYTFSTAKAKEYVKDNLDLACLALTEFGDSIEHLGVAIQEDKWEFLDVSIRCYLLSQVISEILDEKEAE